MSKYDNPCFDDCRKWIQKKRERGASWQNLQLACKHSEEELNAFLSSRAVEDDWPDLSVDEWKALVIEPEKRLFTSFCNVLKVLVLQRFFGFIVLSRGM